VSEIAPGDIHAHLFASLDATQFAAVEIQTTDQLRTAGWFTPAEEPPAP
jgi:hypothetical protein